MFYVDRTYEMGNCAQLFIVCNTELCVYYTQKET
jgi:hypothetical protein